MVLPEAATSQLPAQRQRGKVDVDLWGRPDLVIKDIHQRTVLLPGTKGAGKSYTIAVACNDLNEKGGRYVVLDPTGALPRMSVERDDEGRIKREKPANEVWFRDELNAGNGSEVAQAILKNTSLSFVLNMENLNPADRVKFADDLAGHLYKHNTTATPIVVFFDEAQEFMPTILRKGMPYATECERFIRLGRNKGFGFVVASQRFATVHPNVRELADAVVILRLGGRLNLAALEDLLMDHVPDGQLRPLLAHVQTMPRGEAILFTPYDAKPGESPIKGVTSGETSRGAPAEGPSGSMMDADSDDALELEEGKRKATPPKGTAGLAAFGLEGTSYEERHGGSDLAAQDTTRAPTRAGGHLRTERITPTDGRGNARLNAWSENKALDAYANEPATVAPHIANAEAARRTFAENPNDETRARAIAAHAERDRTIARELMGAPAPHNPDPARLGELAAAGERAQAEANVRIARHRATAASAMGLDARKAPDYDARVEAETQRHGEIEMKSNASRPARMYQRLIQLIPDLHELRPGTARTAQSSGYMDLHLDVLGRTAGKLTLSLAHYYNQNGDTMQDPDMEIAVDFEERTVRALSFQMANPPLYQRADESPWRQRDLDSFLSDWLGNLIDQGFDVSPAPYATAPQELVSAPEPEEPSTPLSEVPDSELVARLDGAPDGTTIFRWRKNGAMWAKGTQQIDSAKLLRTASVAARAYALTLPSTTPPALLPEEAEAVAAVWAELRENAAPITGDALSQDAPDPAPERRATMPTVRDVETTLAAVGVLVAGDDEILEALSAAEPIAEGMPSGQTVRAAGEPLSMLTEDAPEPVSSMPEASVDSKVPVDADVDELIGTAPKGAGKRVFDVELIDPSTVSAEGSTVWEQITVRPFKEEFSEAVTREERRAGRTATDEDKARGRYFTPAPIALAMYALADVAPGDVVMDPTAGEGSLLKPFQTFDPNGSRYNLQACEMHAKDRETLARRRIPVVGNDYFSWRPVVSAGARPDRVVTNPPYGIKYYTRPREIENGEGGNPRVRESAMACLWKSLTELKPGGRLVAIVPYFWVTTEEARGRQKEEEWRLWVQRNFTWHSTIKLWPEVFTKEDTTVTTALIVIDRPREGERSDKTAPEELEVTNYEELYKLVFTLTDNIRRPETSESYESFGDQQRALEQQVRDAAMAHARWLQQHKPDAIPPPPLLGRVPLPKSRVIVEIKNKRSPAKKLKLHQKEAIALALDAWDVRGYRGFVVASDPGLGKTAIGLATLNQVSPRRALIVTKNPQLALDFIKESNEDWNRPITRLGAEKAPGAAHRWPEKEGWYVCTYDYLSDRCQQGNLVPAEAFDLVIFDESHTLNNYTGLPGGKKSNVAKWGTYLADRARRVLYMSATPYETLGQMRYLSATGMFGEPDVEKAMRDGGVMDADEAITQAYTAAFVEWAVMHGARASTGSVIFEKAPEELASVAIGLVMEGRLVKHDARLDGLHVKFDYIQMPANSHVTYTEKLWHWKHVHMRCKGANPQLVGADVAAPHNLIVRERAAFIKNFKANFPGVPHAEKPLDPRSLGAQTMFWQRRFIEESKVPYAIEKGRALLAEGRNVLFLTANISALKDNYARTFKRSVQRVIVPFDWPELRDPHTNQSMELAEDEWDTSQADPEGKRAAQPKLKYVNEQGEEVTVKGRFVYYPRDIQFYRHLAGTQQEYASAFNEIVKAFGGPNEVAVYNGGLSESQKDAQKDAYNEERKHVMVATVSSAGTGLSLHDKKGPAHGGRPRAQITVTLPWTGKEFKQVSGRSHRLGSMSETTMLYPVGDTAQEARMARIVAMKYRSMNASVSGLGKDDAASDVNHSEFLKWDNDSDEFDMSQGDALFMDDVADAAGEPTMTNLGATNVLDAYALTVSVDPTKGGSTYMIETTDFSLRNVILRAQNEKGIKAKYDSRRGVFTLSTRYGMGGVRDALERVFNFANGVSGGRFTSLAGIDAWVDAQLAKGANAYHGWSGDEGAEWAIRAGLIDADEQPLWKGVIEVYDHEPTYGPAEVRVRFLRFAIAAARKSAEQAHDYARGQPGSSGYWLKMANEHEATIAKYDRLLSERGPIGNASGKRSTKRYHHARRPHMAHEQRPRRSGPRVPTLTEIRRLIRDQYRVVTDQDVRAYGQHDIETDTVYIDRDAPAQDHEGLAIHEVAENELEKSGLSHDEAHPIANQIEREAVGTAQFNEETKRAQTIPARKFPEAR